MPIISKETWEKLSQEERDKIGDIYDNAVRKKNNASSSESNKTIFGYSCLIEVLDKLFGKEQLQPQPLTYEDVARELFKNTPAYCATLAYNNQEWGNKLFALGKLLVVAKFLNKDWKPDWGNFDELKYCFYIGDGKELRVTYVQSMNYSPVYFRTEELARQAIEILGEDTVRLALSTDW